MLRVPKMDNHRSVVVHFCYPHSEPAPSTARNQGLPLGIMFVLITLYVLIARNISSLGKMPTSSVCERLLRPSVSEARETEQIPVAAIFSKTYLLSKKGLKCKQSFAIMVIILSKYTYSSKKCFCIFLKSKKLKSPENPS